jgi:acetyl-CoA C-acetyltransferase
MKTEQKVFIIDACRTANGDFGGALRHLPAHKLLGHVFSAILRRTGITASQINEVIVGHCLQNGFEPNTARFAWIDQKLPASVPCMTYQFQCGSGMASVRSAFERIRSGDDDLILAAGVESMSMAPFIISGEKRWKGFIKWFIGSPLGKKLGFKFQGPGPILFQLADNAMAPLRLLKDMSSVNMAATAQRVAETYGISREDADEYALRSHQLAIAAIESGRFEREIEPIVVPSRGVFKQDEHPRKGSSLSALSKLRPVFGTRQVTAGNASALADGASVVCLGSEEKVLELNVKPLARIVDCCVAGVDPEQMGLGPVEAIQKLLTRHNLTLADIDLFEINEAFAAQYLACEKLLGLDRSKVNVNGGAIALGHPLGMSGNRLVLTLAHELKARGKKRGIAALCVGGGMGIAIFIENPDANQEQL